ncbi:hypothetical protein HC031_28605 [Planosporangium thailandense]|uniref:PH domain-containing protein n=1 Tax=Planosporangium thailandense TaxID=765197 RepID=A0ABX0Y897_9ACTN|nr:hypothetical protein [Planosporangium thailandense]NJC73655.1 hypothetical protein [Planosporangium thailandense]
MAEGDQRASRSYRHRPWLAFTVVVSPVLLSFVGVVLVHAVTHPSYRSLMAVLVALAFFGGAQAFVVLSWRMRTVVDDAGVTQYWILRQYRMQWSEVTAMELVRSVRRWYVRIHCGERTFETIPCLQLYGSVSPWQVRALFGLPSGAPRAAEAAYEDMRRRWKAHQRHR